MARTTELRLSPNQNRMNTHETSYSGSYTYALSIARIKYTCYKFRFLARSDFHVHAEMQKAWNTVVSREHDSGFHGLGCKVLNFFTVQGSYFQPRFLFSGRIFRLRVPEF